MTSDLTSTFTAMAQETARVVTADPRVSDRLGHRWIAPILEAAFREVAALQREQDAKLIERLADEVTVKAQSRPDDVRSEALFAANCIRESAAAIRATPETP